MFELNLYLSAIRTTLLCNKNYPEKKEPVYLSELISEVYFL